MDTAVCAAAKEKRKAEVKNSTNEVAKIGAKMRYGCQKQSENCF